MFSFEAYFQDPRHLYANHLFYILSVYCIAFIFYAISSLLNVNLFLFQFLSHGILMHIPILTGVQIGRISRWKNSLLLKNILFKVYFPRWRSLVCQLLLLCPDYFYLILFSHCKCLPLPLVAQVCTLPF